MMGRIVEVKATCDFCDKVVTPEDLARAWDSRQIEVDGTLYLVDACESCVASAGPVIDLIVDTSRMSEEKPKRPKRPKRSDTPRVGPFNCRGCGKELATYRAQRIHETKEHGIGKDGTPNEVSAA